MRPKIIGIGVLIVISIVLIAWFGFMSPGDTIKTKKGATFSVSLESNPTTGYSWQPQFDSNYVQLVDSSYVPSQPNLLGGSGKETFEFLAMSSGTTEITFSYARPWESQPPLETRVFKVVIK
ncbi:MAG: protease inhibitor I42 family protein [Methanocellales archaeon]|nr:protease inhibitor I42 family protein [Methanocellales archaeon]MDD3292276.1 protease inhibitor I42 family protein [Methanocellales archaeon]MDD5235938.1 protease inhibitor I42 family protein [Methanocellales archaeon]MDD5485838.1 protease inhibitor I42 family protein [Methanocellales archaeon]